MPLIKKFIKSIQVEKTWSTTWAGLKWTVLATYEKRLWFIHWSETFEMAGPFSTREEAKRCAKRLRKKYKLN